MIKRHWSDEDFETTARMLAEGASSRAIGRAIGRSGSAVAGMVWRTGRLSTIGFKNAAPKINPPWNRKREEAAVRLKERDGRTIIWGRHLGRSLLELDSGACRFPLWPHDAHPTIEEQFYCAMPKVEDSSYCAHHRKVCAARPKGM